MPDALSDAKAAMAHANRMFPSTSKPASAPASTTTAPAPAKPAPTVADELKAKQDNVKQYAAAPKMHKGGPIKKGGVYNLKRGEHVLAPKEAKKMRMIAGLKSLQSAGSKVKK